MPGALRASLIVFALLGTPGFDRPAPALSRFQFAEVHMGMPVTLTLYAPDRSRAETGARAAFARIARLDAMLSDYRPDSELNRLSATAHEWVRVSPEFFSVLSRALDIAKASAGAFDPTVGPLTMLWRDARKSRRMPSAAAIESARARVGWRLVTADVDRRAVRLDRAGMQLDLGGIAKGFILQEAFVVLEAQGLPMALLDAGGDIVAGDAPPDRPGWDVAVPGADAAFTARAARLVRAALATSGPATQFLEVDGVRYSHVVDPRTGLGLTTPREVHVIAPDGATADALATAIGVLGPSGAQPLLAAFPGILASIHR